MDNETCEQREQFMSIAVCEHHQMREPTISVFEICDRLQAIWDTTTLEAQAERLTLDAVTIMALNNRIAATFGAGPGVFQRQNDWQLFLDECGDINDDPSHVCSWIFSSLYWKHLPQFRLATAWIFVNGIRLQHGLAGYRLSLNKLGPFLESLSGSGPPLFDGQSFYSEDYA